MEKPEEQGEDRSTEFGELLKYTVSGYGLGLVAGALLDHFGLQRNPLGQWIVRTFAGEGESIFEGFYAIRQRLRNASQSMAEAYGWGKMIGMMFPWVVDWTSRMAGVNVYGIEGFFIPYFYALSDQIGANIAGFLFLRRNEASLASATRMYLKNPVMMSSAIVILIVPVGLLAARLAGFSPTTQTYTALETIVANLCWVPPLVGWLKERRASA